MVLTFWDFQVCWWKIPVLERELWRQKASRLLICLRSLHPLRTRWKLVLISFAHDTVSLPWVPVSRSFCITMEEMTSALCPPPPHLARKSPFLHTDGFRHSSAWQCLLTWVHLWSMQCRSECWEINTPGASLKTWVIGIDKSCICLPWRGITFKYVLHSLWEGLQEHWTHYPQWPSAQSHTITGFPSPSCWSTSSQPFLGPSSKYISCTQILVPDTFIGSRSHFLLMFCFLEDDSCPNHNTPPYSTMVLVVNEDVFVDPVNTGMKKALVDGGFFQELIPVGFWL